MIRTKNLPRISRIPQNILSDLAVRRGFCGTPTQRRLQFKILLPRFVIGFTHGSTTRAHPALSILQCIAGILTLVSADTAVDLELLRISLLDWEISFRQWVQVSPVYISLACLPPPKGKTQARYSDRLYGIGTDHQRFSSCLSERTISGCLAAKSFCSLGSARMSYSTGASGQPTGSALPMKGKVRLGR
jgi:hypothetical protein